MKLRLLFLSLLLALPAWAQFTTVTGTVTDPNGLPYAYGTIASAIASSGTPQFTATAALYIQPTQATGLDTTGTFQMRLADVTALTPGGSTYSFTVCSSQGSVPFSFGKGPQCFTINGVSISGSSQDIGATLRAAAPALTVTFAGGGTVTGTGTANTLAMWTGTSALGNSLISQATGTITAAPTSVIGFSFLGTTPTGSSCVTSASATIPTGIQPGTQGCAKITAQINDTAAANNGNTPLWTQNISSAAGTESYGGVLLSQPSASQKLSAGLEAASINTTTSTENAGLIAYASNGGTTAPLQYGVHSKTANSAASTVTLNAALFADSPTNSGTLTANYGLYIADQSAGGGTNSSPHGVHQLGNTPNEFQGHLNQIASGNWAGTCAMAAAATCTFTISAAYTGTPIGVCSIDAASAVPATANSCKVSVSGTTVTITAGASNSLTWDAILVGNPN